MRTWYVQLCGYIGIRIVTTYGFRLRFLTPAGRIMEGSDQEITISVMGIDEPLKLLHLPRKPNHAPGSPEVYIITGSNFSSEEAARQCGEQLKIAVSVYGAESRIGINVGHDKATTSTSQTIKDMYRNTGAQLRDSIHGLDVYPEDLPVRSISISATATTTQVIHDFPDRIAVEYQNLVSLTPKQRLALELYNLSRFGAVIQTRFLNLITVVEILSERLPQSNSITPHIEHFIAEVGNSALSNQEKELLKNGLNNLKKVSISAACRQFVASHSDASAADEFDVFYDARSKMLHQGKTPDDEILYSNRLDEIVQVVLLKSIRGQRSGDKEEKDDSIH
jgi:hypothetical protein